MKNKILKKDSKFIWHPFTQEKSSEAPILVKKAKDLMLKAMQNNASLEQVIKADPLEELGLEYAGWLPKEKVTTLFYRSLK